MGALLILDRHVDQDGGDSGSGCDRVGVHHVVERPSRPACRLRFGAMSEQTLRSPTPRAMSELAGIERTSDTEVDGRTARKDRNRVAVLDAVLSLLTEDNLIPSPDEVAQRSGVSLRSVYRYFADTEALLRAAIDRHLERIEPLAIIDNLGVGTFDERLTKFLDARLRLYEAVAPTARASRLRAATSEVIRDQLEASRVRLRNQTGGQFAAELDLLTPKQRRAAFAAVDTLTQLECIDLYRSNRQFSGAATREMLAITITQLLTNY